MHILRGAKASQRHAYEKGVSPPHSALNVLKYVYLYLFPLELLLSGKLSEYGVIVPFSADCQGRFLSHVVSGSVAARRGKATHPPAPPPHPGRRRVARSTSFLNQGVSGNRLYYFNVTVFGKELHLRLKPNRRLVSPGALTEWQEDFREVFREPLQQDCAFTGGVSGMPGATVAISNCDGLVSKSGLSLLLLLLVRRRDESLSLSCFPSRRTVFA